MCELKYLIFPFNGLPFQGSNFQNLITFTLQSNKTEAHLIPWKYHFLSYHCSRTRVSCSVHLTTLFLLFSCLLMSDSLQPHGPQLARLSCPSLSPGTCSNSCPLSQWCHPTISSSVAPAPPALNLSKHQGLFQGVASHQVAKYWSFSISPSSEYSRLISFRIDWFDLLSVQGTPRSLLQHHNSKASILWPSAFFMVHLSHLYMTTGKTIALTTWTFVRKVISVF